MILQFDEALWKQLKATTALTALVSTRIYNIKAPESITFPFVTFSENSTTETPYLAGYTGDAEASVQISAWSKTLLEARSIADVIRTTLWNYYGMLGGSGGVNVTGVLLDNQLPMYDEETMYYVIHQQYNFMYKR